MDRKSIKKQFYKLSAGDIMPSGFADHVLTNILSNPSASRSIEAYLSDSLPEIIELIEIPEFYSLDERYANYQKSCTMTSPAERPQTSFKIHARTWRDLSAATRLFEYSKIHHCFDIFPTNIYIEGNIAKVCCDT